MKGVDGRNKFGNDAGKNHTAVDEMPARQEAFACCRGGGGTVFWKLGRAEEAIKIGRKRLRRSDGRAGFRKNSSDRPILAAR